MIIYLISAVVTVSRHSIASATCMTPYSSPSSNQPRFSNRTTRARMRMRKAAKPLLPSLTAQPQPCRHRWHRRWACFLAAALRSPFSPATFHFVIHSIFRCRCRLSIRLLLPLRSLFGPIVYSAILRISTLALQITYRSTSSPPDYYG
ncbi:uncharacterized protein BDV17DRAFT_73884 [Aspergillus undulatus]|uniref:uncharacterized protein n=1 Tax=Aspergillus undulatus TaxID=1810928 RepID=UPI003CCCA8B6